MSRNLEPGKVAPSHAVKMPEAMWRDVEALSKVTRVPMAEIVRTGVAIMLKRARDMGYLPPEGQAERDAPTEMATPALRAV